MLQRACAWACTCARPGSSCLEHDQANKASRVHLQKQEPVPSSLLSRPSPQGMLLYILLLLLGQHRSSAASQSEQHQHSQQQKHVKQMVVMMAWGT